MDTATIRFLANSYAPDAIVKGFRRMIGGTGFCFKKAEIIQNNEDLYTPDFVALTLYTNNGYIIKVVGLHCGREGEAIVDLLKVCEFDIDDETVYTILNYIKLNITIWNEKYLEEIP
ncbi:MAG: hypothetical protein IJ220_07960 [Clostridia bacterium]|nr:hypothetical protein [Clostridia bacterium]